MIIILMDGIKLTNAKALHKVIKSISLLSYFRNIKSVTTVKKKEHKIPSTKL